MLLFYPTNFKKQYKKISKQGKILDKIDEVIDKLANFVALWLLTYQYEEEKTYSFADYNRKS